MLNFRLRGCGPTTGLIVGVLLLAGCGGSNQTQGDGTGGGAVDGRYALANACWALRSEATGNYLVKQGDGYAATGASRAEAHPFFFKPSRLGAYLIYDADEAFLGLDDPAGLFLDDLGNFVGSLDGLLAGVGDTVDIVPPLQPVGGLVRDISNGLLGTIAGALGGNAVSPSIGAVSRASDFAVWEATFEDGRFSLQADVAGLPLAVSDDGALGLSDADAPTEQARFRVEAHEGCADYPEITTNASLVNGAPFSGTTSDGRVRGIADTHIHIGAYEFIGGRVNYGSPFHKFGVTHALDDCAVNHGPYGTLGLLEHFTSGSPLPLRFHQTQGWPTFVDWPNHSSLQHHQTYYKWIERMWLGGLRLMINHFTGNEALCQIYPLVHNDCDPMENARLQAQRMFELQDYIDAQAGGPGKGFFRIVTEPEDARRVIEQGKLAVVFGLEFSHLFNCRIYFGQSLCTPQEIDRQLAEFKELGVRMIFPIHRFDNAFGGAYNGKGVTEVVISAGNILATGEPFALEACADPEDDQRDQPPPDFIETLLLNVDFFGAALPGVSDINELLNPQGGTELCNARGITDLGEYLIERLIEERMLIEIDHMGARVRDRVLEIVEQRGYPGIVSSHGFLQTMRSEARVIGAGGMVNRFATTAPQWVQRIQNIAINDSGRHFFATGFSSDINGIANQPGPRGDADERPLEYPFTSYMGDVVFDRQVSGERVFDLNVDGVAHYGLYPDLIADIQQNGGEGREAALELLFNSAEAYLQMWERAKAYRP